MWIPMESKMIEFIKIEERFDCRGKRIGMRAIRSDKQILNHSIKMKEFFKSNKLKNNTNLLEQRTKHFQNLWKDPEHRKRMSIHFKKMSKKYRLNIEDVLKSFRKTHGKRYDYSKVEYKNNATKVKIICKIHGEFLQRPASHRRGQGCFKCGRIIAWEKRHKKTPTPKD
jgi:hypothetical protein